MSPAACLAADVASVEYSAVAAHTDYARVSAYVRSRPELLSAQTRSDVCALLERLEGVREELELDAYDALLIYVGALRVLQVIQRDRAVPPRHRVVTIGLEDLRLRLHDALHPSGAPREAQARDTARAATAIAGVCLLLALAIMRVRRGDSAPHA